METARRRRAGFRFGSLISRIGPHATVPSQARWFPGNSNNFLHRHGTSVSGHRRTRSLAREKGPVRESACRNKAPCPASYCTLASCSLASTTHRLGLAACSVTSAFGRTCSALICSTLLCPARKFDASGTGKTSAERVITNQIGQFMTRSDSVHSSALNLDQAHTFRDRASPA